MKKRIVWLVVSCLMVAALVLASCGPAEEEEEEVTPPAEEEEVAPPPEEEEEEPGKEMVRDSLGRMVEKPKYGGILTFAFGGDDIPTYDEAVMWSASNSPTIVFTNEELVTGDWTKGPIGTGETSWLAEEFPDIRLMTGNLAESWERIDPDTIIWHLREGVHFALNPDSEASRLVAGREFTADDYIFSRERLMLHSNSWHRMTYTDAQRASFSVKKLDKYTVEEHFGPNQVGEAVRIGGDYGFMVPREVVDAYGDLSDWRHSVGTGPYILKDVVSSSQVTFVRNPNYWRKHPLYPEDTMPYHDGIKILMIPDMSTRMSALRTAKLDATRGITWEDGKMFLRTNPELQYLRHLPSNTPYSLFFRTDQEELPYDDIRVRKALAMGINRQAIKDDYFQGNAEYLASPITPYAEFSAVYVPLEELPASVQEQWDYNPTKARQLLADAGYPDGFKTSIVTWAGSTQIDLLSIVKDDWAEIGVDLTLDTREYGAYVGVLVNRTHPEGIIMSWVASTPRSMNNVRPAGYTNWMMIDDPYLNDVYNKTQELFFDWDALSVLWKEKNVYILEQAWYIELPTPYLYAMWQPWLKDYHAEYSPGCWNLWQAYTYTWIDQDMKEEMTGRR